MSKGRHLGPGVPSKRIAVVDYGVGNLRSVRRGLEHAGAEVEVTGDPNRLAAASGIVLPGVGAFAPAVEKLRATGLDAFLVAQAHQGQPILGVCLGYQLLFELSYEDGRHAGLGLLPGPVRRLPPVNKVPHMGWNRLRQVRPDVLFEGIADRAWFYFVHSYYPELKIGEEIIGTADYGRTLGVVARRGSVAGTQFHPEKSGAAGLRLYANFVASCH
ncbi:MAG TPA: imidazole glycerol phosphate synthase subunit HisH [Candidatus Dormibacteraeota bacterium]|jgi:glutamine amidotransferase|nr:imidazole glycerol phosphate synthase subunit HisH [Candidatus Dormibacteraeota bacterium]